MEVTLAVRCLTWALAETAAAAAAAQGLPDAELVRELVRSGDDDLFAVLVQRHKRKVHRLAAAVLGPGREHAAEDVAQEAFVLVYRKLASFRHQCAFSTWLFRLTRNLAIDHRRRAQRQLPQVPIEQTDPVADNRRSSDPEGLVAADQRRTQVLERVERLPEVQRMVVYLHYWTGSTLGEIAALLELKRETVKSHLYRARRRLAAEMNKESRHG